MKTVNKAYGDYVKQLLEKAGEIFKNLTTGKTGEEILNKISTVIKNAEKCLKGEMLLGGTMLNKLIEPTLS